MPAIDSKDGATVPRCLVWSDAEGCPPFNMAADEVILGHVSRLDAVLRFYGWSEPAVTIGYFQPFTTAPQQLGRVIRRLTGGGVVRHTHDVTFSITVGRNHPLFQVDRFSSYRLVNEAVLDAVEELGVDAWLTQHATEVEDRRHLVCFDSPARYDVVAAGGKVCGGAQRRSADGMLVQSSIDRDQLPDMSRADIVAALTRRLAPILGDDVQPWLPDPALIDESQALADSKYDTVAWNRRR